jgi:Inorganic Pyrophosphatase/Protein of unknown function (DUF3626)
MPISAQKKIDIVGTDPRYLPGWHQPKPEDEFLHLNLGGDYDRYIEMRRDAHIRAKLEKRVNSLLARPLIFEGGKRPQDIEAIAIAQKLADTMAYDSLCEAVLDTGPLVGFAVLKIEEVQRNIEVVVDQKVIRKSLIAAEWEYVPQNRFRFAYHEPNNRSVPVATDEELDPATEIMLVGNYELRLLTTRSPFFGERCPKNSFMFFQFGFGQGTPWGLGLGYSLYPWWSIKREAVKAWILHAENTGQSPVAASLPENFDPKNNEIDREIETRVENFLAGVSPNNWVMLPYGINVNLLSDLADKPDVLERLIGLCNSEMSKILLGEVSYSENGTGSYAANASQVDDIQSTTIDADANLFDNQAQRSLWNRLFDLNAPKAQAVKVRRESRSDIRLADMERAKQEQLGTTLGRDKELLAMGWRRTNDSMAETYGASYEQTQGENKEPPLITTLGVGGIQAFTSLLAASGIQSTRASTIKTISTMFGVAEDVVALMVPEDNRPEQPSLESLFGGGDGAAAPAEPSPSEPTPAEDTVNLTEDFGAIIDRVIKWNGLELGVEYLPGQVRFPGRKHSRKLRAGYGHIRRHVGADGEALDCYLHSDFFDDLPPADKIYEISQLDENGEFDELKLMIGWGTIGEAKDAYLQEMPADRFGGVMPLAFDKLAQYAKPAASVTVGDEDEDEYFDGLEMSEPEAELHLMGGVLAVIAGNYDFATATAPKKKNCNPAKSHFCPGSKGGACVSLSKACASPAKGSALAAAQLIQSQNTHAARVAAFLQSQSGQNTPAGRAAAFLQSQPSQNPATAQAAALLQSTPSPQLDPVKLNDKQLTASRAALVKKHGQALVDAAEQNVAKVLKDADVFVRVGSTDTLETILGDRFKTSAELGIKTHKIPDLKDNYQVARNRVEAKVLGYDEKSTDPADRPIYGYLGGSNMNGAAHSDVAGAYGSIALKLKPEVRDRTSFTGADSFKSGIASKLTDPNAASLASVTRFGHDIDSSKVPGHLQSIGQNAQRNQLSQAAKAKTIDDLNRLSPTGNQYIEAQIHGQLKPSDIAEMHFEPRDSKDQPSAAIAKFAKDNGVKLYVRGKQVNPDDILNPPKAKASAKLPAKPKNRVTDLSDEVGAALKSGDFSKVSDLVDAMDADIKKVKLATNETDRHLKYLFKEAGYDGKPQVVTKAAVDQALASGATAMVRGVSQGRPRGKFTKQFRTGNYFTGNGIYGNGTYVGHAGSVTKGTFKPGGTTLRNTRAATSVISANYISPSTDNMRMALPKDANVITQSEMAKQIKKLKTAIDQWEKAELKKPGGTNAKAKAKRMRELLFGDEGTGSSGRFGVIMGYDAIALDKSYSPKTFMNLLNRSKVLVQDTSVGYRTLSSRGVNP